MGRSKNQGQFFLNLGKNEWVRLGVVLVVCLAFLLWKLDKIPGEWFGDISSVDDHTQEVLTGKWPFYYWGSTGPIYYYVIAPLILVWGNNYIGYKLASIAVGILGLIGTYLLANKIAGRHVGLLTVFVAGCSFWNMARVRVADSQVLLPALSSLTVYLAIKTLEFEWFLTPGIFVASLGLFVFPQSWLLPVVFLSILLWKSRSLAIKAVVLFLPALIMFLFVVNKQKDNFTNGYVGSKIFSKQSSTNQLFKMWITNLEKTALMLHWRGDVIFRANVPLSPHLDPISGLLFIIGLVYLLKTERKIAVWLVLIPIVLLILPSTSPALSPSEIPSSSRTFGAAPFIFFLVAVGLTRIRSKLALTTVLILIGYLNGYKYFVIYPRTLPNGNTPYGKIIAKYIDGLPIDTTVKVANCCWGEWGQPEPKGIYHQLNNKKNRESIEQEKYVLSCEQVPQEGNLVIIANPNDTKKMDELLECRRNGTVHDGVVFKSVEW